MTRVRYDRAGLRLEMEGHAGAGPRGADLTCAALSILMMTIERRMRERAEKTLPSIYRGPGRFVIACRPGTENEALCRESFDTVAAGLEALAENRAQYVSFCLTGEDLEEEDEQ